MIEVKCSLGFDPRFGPIVEVGKLTAKSTERVRSLLTQNSELFIMDLGTKGSLKFGDPVWTDLHQNLQCADAQLLKEETKIFLECCETISAKSDEILSMCKYLSELDISVHAAIFSKQNNYTQPEMTQEYQY